MESAIGWLWTSWLATSYSDFWRRWNPVLHRISLNLYRFIRKRIKLHRSAEVSLLIVFLFNGFWHDVIISLVVGRSTGGFWMFFFFFNGVAVLLDKKAVHPPPTNDLFKLTLYRGLVIIWIFCSLCVSGLLSDLILLTSQKFRPYLIL